MSYTKTTWVNGTTPVNADNMNNIEDGIANALTKLSDVLSSSELVGIGVNGEQVRIQLGDGLTLSGSESPYTLSASGGGGGGGFTPRLLAPNESVTNMGDGYNLTKEDLYFELAANTAGDWTFMASVKCYLTFSTSGSVNAGYRILNADESFSLEGSFFSAKIRIYVLEEYDADKQTIGYFYGVPS